MSADDLDRVDWALKAGNLTQTARLLLVRLCRAARSDLAIVSIAGFARAGKIHRRTMQRHLDQMVRCGLVRVEKRTGGTEAVIHILFGGRQ